MRKILGLLGAAGLIVSSTSAVIACGGDKTATLDFTTRQKSLESAKTVYDIFKGEGDYVPKTNGNLVINFKLPGDVSGKISFNNKQYKDIFTSENNAEILKALRQTQTEVKDKSDLNDVEKNFQKAFNNYYVTKSFMDGMKTAFDAAGANSSGNVKIENAYNTSTKSEKNKKEEYDALATKLQDWMNLTFDMKIPENTYISEMNLDYKGLTGWKIHFRLMIDVNNNGYDASDKDESDDIALDVKKLKDNSTDAEVANANAKASDSWLSKAKNNISLGIYKIKLFIQQLVLTNGKDWLADVLSGLMQGFAESALTLIPAIKALLKVPGAEYIFNKFVIAPIADKIATPLADIIVKWAEDNKTSTGSMITNNYVNNMFLLA
ncbi:lipoprotein [Spiroplasma tabanidicola]|uniref:Lipoprotein n=1 Tax=Spiroplasma tabanidicola TaxID=324079 RepID=A0A6I6C712_9MOLU|nr:lipoprotein [Spiroplasma tabanidicola]QGS51576.1 hypothetical protein STABA_v1c02090 [Spiroplasma tabanidicola]